MDKLMQEYLKTIIFEEFTSDELAASNLDSLETKQGIIIQTDTTDLWITRKLSVMGVLGTPTVFESANEFMLLDDFGMKLWDGNVEEMIEYVKGFVSGVEPEFE